MTREILASLYIPFLEMESRRYPVIFNKSKESEKCKQIQPIKKSYKSKGVRNENWKTSGWYC